MRKMIYHFSYSAPLSFDKLTTQNTLKKEIPKRPFKEKRDKAEAINRECKEDERCEEFES